MDNEHNEALTYIKRRVETLKEAVNNPIGTLNNEVCHRTEDNITYDTLKLIANGRPYAQELAQTALEVYDLDYDRWYA